MFKRDPDAAPTLAWAEGSVEPNTISDEVVVSGAKISETETAASVHVIDSKTMEENKPIFVGQMINAVPGVICGNRATL